MSPKAKLRPDFLEAAADVDQSGRRDRYARGLIGGNLLLYGDYGTGKSIAAEIIARTILSSSQIIIPTLHVIEAQHWSAKSAGEILGAWNAQRIDTDAPVTIINEVDQLKGTQLELRALYDEYPWGRFILTTNHLHLIDAGLRSRCREEEIRMPSPATWLPRAQAILQQNGIYKPAPIVLRLLEAANRSVRDYGMAWKRSSPSTSCKHNRRSSLSQRYRLSSPPYQPRPARRPSRPVSGQCGDTNNAGGQSMLAGA